MFSDFAGVKREGSSHFLKNCFSCIQVRPIRLTWMFQFSKWKESFFWCRFGLISVSVTPALEPALCHQPFGVVEGRIVKRRESKTGALKRETHLRRMAYLEFCIYFTVTCFVGMFRSPKHTSIYVSEKNHVATWVLVEKDMLRNVGYKRTLAYVFGYLL